ncbi:hypothetical protein GDO86_010042 [Hymenochirus boettgeri]|uniref:Transmembrane protein 44 n=1 Tax=Hymenochirus boettgeri TaxID=247094 RepID=A0A8T2JIX9_9PIPI|nr:hypothetical protein GDO86_010042 [Hymenochirus boettgeri]
MNGAMNVTAEGLGRPGLWGLDYLLTCFAQEKICVSFGLWLLSSLFWLMSCSIQFYVRCTRKSKHEVSVFWDIYGFIGSLCNTVGALLSNQLTIQVITGCYMAFADVGNFLLTLFPVCNAKHRPRSPRKSIMFAVSITALMGIGSHSLLPHTFHTHKMPHAPQRRLLESALQERIDVVGFSLGIIAVIVSWTTRVPLITKVCRGNGFTVMQIWSIFFSVLASIMYVAAIMSHDRRPEYFIRAVPWFLISLGSASLDVALMLLACIMKNKVAHKMGLFVDLMDGSDHCALLAQENEKVEKMEENNGPFDDLMNSWTPLNMVPDRNKNCKKSHGRYMILSIEQVQVVGTEEVRSPGDGMTSCGKSLNKEVICNLDPSTSNTHQVAIDRLSTTSSSEVSSSNNEMEWDFEDFNPQWNDNGAIINIHAKDGSVLGTSN